MFDFDVEENVLILKKFNVFILFFCISACNNVEKMMCLRLDFEGKPTRIMFYAIKEME